MKRHLGLDIGTKRIGVAVSDPLGSFAQGVAVLNANEDWVRALDGLVKEYRVAVIVVGMPLRTDGSAGPEAEKIEALKKVLAERYDDLDVVEWDERFTTVRAEQALLEGDVSRKGRKSRIDMVAASILLQDYLDFLRRDGFRE
ncbi:MAG: Holliday junction resolvase RuvX [Thermovirgaceae bacterium]